MLIAANSFPGKPDIDQLVLAILKTGVPRYASRYAMRIPDMVDQGISPVDQFKLIFIDGYNLDFDSAISQKYLAPDVPDFDFDSAIPQKYLAPDVLDFFSN
jgi:hypothetical protein